MTVVEMGSIKFLVDSTNKVPEIYARTNLQTFKVVWVDPQRQQPKKMTNIANLILAGEVSCWNDLIELTRYEDKHGIMERRITVKDVSAWKNTQF